MEAAALDATLEKLGEGGEIYRKEINTPGDLHR